jgi:hypothetical protein
MAHASFDYRFRLLQLFYDTGSVWDNKQAAIARHSVGIGLGLGNLRDGLTVSVGFPIRDGHLQPLFLMSANF